MNTQNSLRARWLLGLISFFAPPAFALTDPAAPGPLAVTREEYRLGEQVFTRPDYPEPVELEGSVHYPTDLSRGPFPVVMFLHGRHATCQRNASSRMEWPCTGGYQSLRSYLGYNYMAERLASHGYIVISISANGVNAFDSQTRNLGADQRAELVQGHLDLWKQFNTVGGAPFGGKFIGRLALDRVGTLGHSRGGEGVMRHVLYNRDQGSPYGLRAVLALAPTNFSRWLDNDIAMGVVLPYCDGDVKNLEGVHYFDDARYSRPGDPTPKHTILMYGANHNFYNTEWSPPTPTARDDWNEDENLSDPHCGRGAASRLTPALQQAAGMAYIVAFFRTHLGNEKEFLPYLTGDATPPASAQGATVLASYHPPDAPSERLDLNRLTQASNLTTNTLGAEAKAAGHTTYRMCGGSISRHCETTISRFRQPHTAGSLFAGSKPGLAQLQVGWSSAEASYHNDLPAPNRDLRAYRTLQFRAGINFVTGPANGSHDARVTLIDGAGQRASARVSQFSRALMYPPGEAGPYSPDSTNVVPRILLNTVRIPLAAFQGVNLADVHRIEIGFDKGVTGSLMISDVAVVDSVSAGTLRITRPASASPNPVPERTTILDVDAEDSQAGSGALTYTWSGSPFPVVFSVNGSNAAKRTVARFSRGGSYTIVVKVTTPSGESVTSQVTVEVGESAAGVEGSLAVDLTNVRVFPNPWNASKHPGSLILFDNLTADAEVKLFTISSRWVRSLRASSGLATWDLTNDKGQPVASGYYLYLITDSAGHQARGKLAIIR